MIALTAGEPAGIGPDLCCLLASQGQLQDVIVLADPDVLAERAVQLGLDLRLEAIAAQAPLPAAPCPQGVLRVQPVRVAQPVRCGQLDVRNAAMVLESLREAVSGCQQGRFSAMVTAPVHKGIINEAGLVFSGHTEYLQALTHTEQVVMMLASERLRVALVTTHLPLAAVPAAITAATLQRVLTVLHDSLVRHFGCQQPEIVVAGLNPHAGESGHLGREEIDVLMPVLEHLRHSRSYRLTGPLPADTMVSPHWLERADAFLAMYHDQGLPVLKTLSFGEAVNITLGLPIIRTSVDHGTALELAGSGEIHSGSLLAALAAARSMAATSAGGSTAARRGQV